MLSDEIDDWPPPPPEQDFEYGCFIQGLLHATYELRECEPEFGLSCGMSAIQHAADTGLRSDETQIRAALLSELALAHAKVRLASPMIDRDELANGIDAAIGLVVYIFESEKRRASITTDDLNLLRAHSRIARNDLHSASLLAYRIPKTREARRSGTLSSEAFDRTVRHHFSRMASNEIMNEELRKEVRGRQAPNRRLRLIA